MKYYYQIEGDLRNNIGDVLQGMVAKAFLPTQAIVVNREDLAGINKTQKAYFIANGWYMHSFDRFSLPDSVTPLYVSIHVANAEFLKNQNVRKHFIEHSPIGCRDNKTLKLFLGWGIPAYYSGCLTVTSQPRAEINNTGLGECLLVDNVDHPIPEEVKKKLESLLNEPLVRVSHDPPDVTGSLEEYNEKATLHMEKLLTRYCNARLVITTKIHCALPCLGMGANVLVIHPDPSDPRLDTVREFINIISYDQVMILNSIKLPDVDKEALKNRKVFLTNIIYKGLESFSNPINKQYPEYLKIKKESIMKAKFYHLAIKFMKIFRIKKAHVSRVYGS